MTGMECPHCGSGRIAKDGKKRGKQRYACNKCGRVFIHPKILADVATVIKGEIVGRPLRRKAIFLESDVEGNLSDGRPVKLVDGVWRYEAQ